LMSAKALDQVVPDALDYLERGLPSLVGA